MLRLQNSRVFFFKISSHFSLVPDLLFDCSRVLEYAKYGLFCSQIHAAPLNVLFVDKSCLGCMLVRLGTDHWK